jgi:hypothetical protein
MGTRNLLFRGEVQAASGVVKTLVVDLRVAGLGPVSACAHATPCYNGVVEHMADTPGA